MFFNIGQTLILATHNEGKLREIGDMLKGYPLKIISAAHANLPEPVEDGHSFADNALLKARAACRATQLPALADDSGLEVRALNNAPGIYSARYGGEGNPFEVAIQRVLDELGDTQDRRARFVSMLALVTPHSLKFEQSHCFLGAIDGHITHEPRGAHGFGYDPIFVPQGYEQTFAELSHDEKNKISHRARSFELFRRTILP